MNIQPYGDRALLINFDQKIEEQVSHQVVDLNNRIESSSIKGLTFLIPAFCSLTVGFDPSLTTFEDIHKQIKALPPASESETDTFSPVLKIPICYEPEFALDMEEVMVHTGLNASQVIEAHVMQTYRVYMLGFVAGFTYLGKLPASINCPRKQTPRLKVPKGSVGLAGFQTGIYPTDAPGGWQIIGRTPLNIFDPKKANPALFKPGERVRFHAVDLQEFKDIAAQVGAGTYEMEVTDG